jgi:hypothetical protein
MRIALIANVLAAQVLFVSFPNQAWANACINPPASSQAIAEFKSNPGAIIPPNADTRTVEATVRELAGTDATLARELVHLAQRAMPRYQTAIAAGLAQAAVACTSIDRQGALLIEQAVAEFEDNQFQAAFAAVAGDLSTAATDAAAASAASSVGSVIVTNPNRSPGLPTNFAGEGATALVQLPSTVVTISAITVAATASTTTSTATAASPVSPTR